MNIQDVIEKCIVCPGICTYRCPTFDSTKYRAAAPLNIARAIYFHSNLDREGYGKSIGYCTLCYRCMDTCPINNPLPDVIKSLRRELRRLEELKFTPMEGVIYRFNNGDDWNIVRLGKREYKIVDTSDLYLHVSYGYLNRQELYVSYNEDPDVFLNNYSIQLLRDLRVNIPIERYVLHRPCKVSSETLEMFRDIFGREEYTLDICLGGGGLDLIAPELLNRIKNEMGPHEIPIITQCSRAAKRMREWGFKAYTPIETVVRIEEIDR